MCGKQKFVSRKAARSAAKKYHPNGKLAAYQCGDYWHYGHKDYPVMRGFQPRDRGER